MNIRMFEPAQIGPVRIRLLDGAETGGIVGEHGPLQVAATVSWPASTPAAGG